MKILIRKNVLPYIFVAIFLVSGHLASAQTVSGPSLVPRPLLQDLKVYSETPDEPDTTLVKKTGSSTESLTGVRAVSSDPVLADVEIPGYSGILVQTLDGRNVIESLSNATFNPASNVKIATAYAVLKTFGPGYRFPTNVWTDGAIDTATSTLNGNLYVSGKDPVFGYEHAVTLAYELNKLGIRNVTGDLVVTGDFTMNYSESVARSSQALFATLDSSKRSPAATGAWLNYLRNSGKGGYSGGIPSITFTGSVYAQPIPSNLKLLFTHESTPMREIIKATLCYSNNFLAERLGDMLGGAYAVARIVQQNTGSQPSEFYLQTSSGLGINRVSPAAMMRLLRALRNELAASKLTFADIIPVAGIDKGTLEKRFDTDFSKGSVIGKTGTLGNTDGGVSALAGEINTRSGKLLFVVFNQHGSVSRFRAFQNSYVSLIQGQFGGATPINYKATPLDVRLARSRVTYADVRSARN
jgi:D-alanyl-D-alanine carboxypeptidase/D-alanyl-D-alanine-endopeptidase (penicillin-binding protein 4)